MSTATARAILDVVCLVVLLALLGAQKAEPPGKLSIQCEIGGVVQRPEPAADFAAYGSSCTANGLKLDSITVYQGH